MGLTDFGNLLRAFGSEESDVIDDRQLFKEVSLITLARATSADWNTKAIEIETVQRILKRLTDEDISAADIRLASKSALFEKAPLARYIKRASRKLAAADRLAVAQGLEEVIRSDTSINPFEAEFYDMVADALRLSPSELVGLTAEPFTRTSGGDGGN